MSSDSLPAGIGRGWERIETSRRSPASSDSLSGGKRGSANAACVVLASASSMSGRWGLSEPMQPRSRSLSVRVTKVARQGERAGEFVVEARRRRLAPVPRREAERGHAGRKQALAIGLGKPGRGRVFERESAVADNPRGVRADIRRCREMQAGRPHVALGGDLERCLDGQEAASPAPVERSGVQRLDAPGGVGIDRFGASLGRENATSRRRPRQPSPVRPRPCAGPQRRFADRRRRPEWGTISNGAGSIACSMTRCISSECSPANGRESTKTPRASSEFGVSDGRDRPLRRAGCAISPQGGPRFLEMRRDAPGQRSRCGAAARRGAPTGRMRSRRPSLNKQGRRAARPPPSARRSHRAARACARPQSRRSAHPAPPDKTSPRPARDGLRFLA